MSATLLQFIDKFRGESVAIDFPEFRLLGKGGFVICGLSTLAIVTYSWTGDPIRCYKDGTSDVAENFFETICLSQATFTSPAARNQLYPGVGFIKTGDPIIRHAYYQWIPLLLCVFAILNYAPKYLWYGIEGGAHAELILTTKDKVNQTDEELEQFVDTAVQYIETHVQARRWLFAKYFICNVLAGLTICVQVFTLESVLNNEFLGYMTTVITNRTRIPEIFPTVTHCRIQS
jgi:hypothetical protein